MASFFSEMNHDLPAIQKIRKCIRLAKARVLQFIVNNSLIKNKTLELR
ncbi:MAG: hypothetical protein RL095_3791 [Verrucomicrobiota bacterium]|jgi:hypothetical protein